MDVKVIPAPPIVIAAITCVLYGFGVFDTFSDERSIETSTKIALKTTAPIADLPQAAARPPASNAPVSINPAPININQNTPTISLPPTSTATEANYKVVARESVVAQHQPLAINSNQSANEEDELVSITNEVEGDDQEPLIAAPPSMATQATPVEISDEGEVEQAAPEVDG